MEIHEMTLLLCGLVALAFIGVVLLYVAYETRSGLLKVLCALFGAAALLAVTVGLIAFCALIMDYLGADHKARIMNREYGTTYTQEEVFYASSVIDTVRELDRKRMEINVDILKTK